VQLFGHKWNPPGWPYIQPKEEAEADALRLKEGLISPRRLQAERGRDWDDVASEIIEDRAMLFSKAIEKAEELETAYPDAGIDWRELAGMEAAPVAQPTDDTEENDDAEQNDENTD
jgi:hypothetical protein